MSRPRAAAAVCLVVPRNQQVAELFVYTLDVSHYFPRGRYTATFLVSTGIFFSFFSLLFLVYFFLKINLHVEFLRAGERQSSGMRSLAETCALTLIHSPIPYSLGYAFASDVFCAVVPFTPGWSRRHVVGD